jgi:ribosomal protein L14
MDRHGAIAIVSASLAVAVTAACSSFPPADHEERARTVVEECRAHGGVIAFDDQAVVCADQTSDHERG